MIEKNKKIEEFYASLGIPIKRESINSDAYLNQTLTEDIKT
jgi:hypothetical protein